MLYLVNDFDRGVILEKIFTTEEDAYRFCEIYSGERGLHMDESLDILEFEYYFQIEEYLRDELYDYLENGGICSTDELETAFYFGGRTKETMETMLFRKTGYRSLEQIADDYGW